MIVGGDRRTSLEVGLGATIFASALHGKANADNLGKDDHLLTVAPFGELRLRQRVTPGFASVWIQRSSYPCGRAACWFWIARSGASVRW